MNGTNVFMGALNLVSGTIIAAGTIISNKFGNRKRSDTVVTRTPKPSVQFTGRSDILATLKEHFSDSADNQLRRRKYFLLYGMGGIGKTQICLRFIEGMSDSFAYVFWIDASSTGTITQGLKGICDLPEAQSSALDGSPESALWWIGSLRDNYAVIFDNADALTPEELEVYFPPGLGGNILITSRNPAMQRLTSLENSLEVGEMGEYDAGLLLLKASCLDTSRKSLQAEASKIVKELFCIPLAVDQAGAFIASGATNIQDFLKKYSQEQEMMLSHSEFRGSSQYMRTVYETWELSYKEIQRRAESDDPHRAKGARCARLLLSVFAFFHYDNISDDIFSYAATQQHWICGDGNTPGLTLASVMLDCTLLPLNEAGTWDNFNFKEGLQVLLSFHFINLGLSDGVYVVHPLIHAWIRDRMSLDQREKSFNMAYVTLLRALYPNFECQPYGFRRGLVTHVMANMQHGRMSMGGHDMQFDTTYEKFGRLLQEQGYANEAENLERQILNARNRIFGEEHPDTIRAMENLAATNRALGKYVEAEMLEVYVLNARNRNLGAEHPDTVRAMENLAETFRDLGKYKEAEELQIHILDVRNRDFGEHPNTIRAMANLAVTFRNLGKYIEAEKLQMQVLDASNRILGAEHPYIIRAMQNLAVIYSTLGKCTEAEKLEIQVLDSSNRLLGAAHPDTIRAMGNLAETFRDLGKYLEAERLQIQVLNARTKILCEGHPDKITAMANLALIFRDLGKYKEAEKLEIHVLDASNRILGTEHPDTIRSMAGLALTFRNLGKYTEAEKLQMHVLDARNRNLGAEHPYMIMAMEDLAVTYSTVGKYKEAEKLQIQVLNTRTRILGEGHTDTVRAKQLLQ